MADINLDAATAIPVQHDNEVVNDTLPKRSNVANCTLQVLRQRTASHRAALERLSECRESLVAAAELVTLALVDGHTVFTLGNGGSAAEAQHFGAELVGRFRLQRQALPVLALTTDSSILTSVANDYCFADVFARQIEAFARDGDVLIAFSTSGDSENAVRAAQAARARGTSVIAMTGERASKLERLADVIVQAPSTDTPTIQELHSLFTHVICDVAESTLAKQIGVRPA